MKKFNVVSALPDAVGLEKHIVLYVFMNAIENEVKELTDDDVSEIVEGLTDELIDSFNALHQHDQQIIKDIVNVMLDDFNYKSSSRLERLKKCNLILKEPFDVPALAILQELENNLVLTDEEMEHLIQLCLDVYCDYDYATPTGIGVLVANHFYTLIESGDTIDFMSITEEDIRYIYEHEGEWR